MIKLIEQHPAAMVALISSFTYLCYAVPYEIGVWNRKRINRKLARKWFKEINLPLEKDK